MHTFNGKINIKPKLTNDIDKRYTQRKGNQQNCLIISEANQTRIELTFKNITNKKKPKKNEQEIKTRYLNEAKKKKL